MKGMKGDLLDYNPLSGIATGHHYDETEDATYIESCMDAEPIIEANKAAFNSVDERARWADNHNRVASIPLTIYWDLKRRGIIDDQVRLKKWLNDPDNRAFRTRPGVV